MSLICDCGGYDEEERDASHAKVAIEVVFMVAMPPIVMVSGSANDVGGGGKEGGTDK